MPSAREALTSAALDHFLTGGATDESLRTTATALGVGHSLLIYHFGSRDGLLAAVHAACEQRLRDDLAALEVGSTDPSDVIGSMWRHLADPLRWPLYRLGFALVARTGQAPEDDVRFWTQALRPLVVATGTPDGDADDEALLWLATTRGLLWQLVTGADPGAVDRAAERFLAGSRRREVSGVAGAFTTTSNVVERAGATPFPRMPSP